MDKIIEELELNLRDELIASDVRSDIIGNISNIVLDTLKTKSGIVIGQSYFYNGECADDPENNTLVKVIFKFRQEDVEKQLGYPKDAEDKGYEYFLVRGKDGIYFEVNQYNLSEEVSPK